MSDSARQAIGNDETQFLTDELKYKTSRIIITFYDKRIPSSKSLLNYGPFSTEVIYESLDQSVLNAFDELTNLGEKRGYYCCPDRNYTIAFYDGTNNYQNYYVDTVESKDNVRIFQDSYQFSYIVKKTNWKVFLSGFNKISFNEYFISDLELARKVYSYTKNNNLPIVTSNRVSKEWVNFDGDFKVKVAVVGEKLDSLKVLANIKKTYPHDKFKIETISHYEMCDSSGLNDCYEEIILQIFCNKDFYDRFNIYGPKSFYDEAIAEFYVLGTRDKLDQIDLLAKKNE